MRTPAFEPKNQCRAQLGVPFASAQSWIAELHSASKLSERLYAEHSSAIQKHGPEPGSPNCVRQASSAKGPMPSTARRSICIGPRLDRRIAFGKQAQRRLLPSTARRSKRTKPSLKAIAKDKFRRRLALRFKRPNISAIAGIRCGQIHHAGKTCAALISCLCVDIAACIQRWACE
jgi:hypothetical protein